MSRVALSRDGLVPLACNMCRGSLAEQEEIVRKPELASCMTGLGLGAV
jgi:hypothetical protein